MEFCPTSKKNVFKSLMWDYIVLLFGLLHLYKVNTGNCLEVTGGDLSQWNCTDFTQGCPDVDFKSNTIYNYSACQEINTEHQCYFADPSCPNTTQLPHTSDGSLVLVGLVAGAIVIAVSLAVILIIFVIIYICKEKAKIRTSSVELQVRYSTSNSSSCKQAEFPHDETLHQLTEEKKCDEEEDNSSKNEIPSHVECTQPLIEGRNSVEQKEDPSVNAQFPHDETLHQLTEEKKCDEEEDNSSKNDECTQPLIEGGNSVEQKEDPSINDKTLIDEPQIIKTIHTEYTELYGVRCLNDEQIWTYGFHEFLRLYNLEGKQLDTIQTNPTITPGDIAVTKDGDLVYTDTENRTVNLVKNRQIQCLITFKSKGWSPLKVCSTSSRDLLVTVKSVASKACALMRYSHATKQLTIQFNKHDHPLSLTGGNHYICENKNLDICVADCTIKAVVVISQSRNLRFTYTGYSDEIKSSFDPHGITTDSKSHILTADVTNNCIHILDQDAHFLSCIQNCHLESPWGLCVDTRDNLFVAEFVSAKVKIIDYMH